MAFVCKQTAVVSGHFKLIKSEQNLRLYYSQESSMIHYGQMCTLAHSWIMMLNIISYKDNRYLDFKDLEFKNLSA